MLSIRTRAKEFDFDFTFYLILTKICGANLNLVPLKGTSLGSLDLRLIDRGVLAKGDVPIKDKETKPVIVQSANRIKHYYLRVGCSYLFFSCNGNSARLANRMLVVFQIFSKHLISSTDDLMEFELYATFVVMCTKILNCLVIVIRVVDFNFVSILLLEVEVDSDFLDKLWVERVMNNFSLSDHLPPVLHKLV